MKLLFVYNANSGAANLLLDIGHKLLSPDTYACNLCSLTHGALRERTAWKAFRESSDHELEFLHKDEFEAAYEASFDYPVILQHNGELEVYLSTDEINAMTSVEELIASLEA